MKKSNADWSLVWSVFLTDTPVRDYATALKGGAAFFKKFFLAAFGGVYLALSPCGVGFLGIAHDGLAIDRACEVFAGATL